MFEVVSGNISEGIYYQVTGTGSITYNGSIYNIGDVFIGIDSITTYTKNSGTEIVTQASQFIGIRFEIGEEVFTGNFNDSSKAAITLEVGDRVITSERFVNRGGNFILRNGKLFNIPQ